MSILAYPRGTPPVHTLLVRREYEGCIANSITYNMRYL